MALHKGKERECAFQLVYSFDFTDSIETEDDLKIRIDWLMHEFKLTKKNAHAVNQIAKTLFEKKEALDAVINQFAIGYPLERITKVELALLRLLIWEVHFEKTTPLEVAMSEARRLCKKFSYEKGADFVTAVLEAACKRDEKDKPSDI